MWFRRKIERSILTWSGHGCENDRGKGKPSLLNFATRHDSSPDSRGGRTEIIGYKSLKQRSKKTHEPDFAPWLRCCAGPTSCRLNAVPMSARCENACGKLPSCRCAVGSYSSASRPTSLRSESR